ncbi:MAG: hypothetical protein E7645_00360 [Ruminococcaceae bacterium]|nr:hypothetical protein [Oscillospiraceae bacterium]
MKKKLLIVLCAALLVVSAAACSGGSESESTNEGVQIPVGTGNENVVTDTNGEIVTIVPDATDAPGEDNISEENPTFTDINKTLYVWVANATIRTETKLGEDYAVAWTTEGTQLTATGESEKWYRITYEGETRYIAKTVAGDYALIAGMTPVDNEEIEISADVNVRTFPSTDGGDLTIRGGLTKGTKVTRVAKGETWSCILFTVKSETETTADGKPVETVKQYFIINECIKSEATGTTAATEEVKA